MGLFNSGIQENQLILSLEQTQDVKPEKEEEDEQEEEVNVEIESSITVLVKKEEKSPQLDVVKLFTEMVGPGPVGTLYERFKHNSEALTLLAPAAGDTIIPLDFGCPG